VLPLYRATGMPNLKKSTQPPVFTLHSFKRCAKFQKLRGMQKRIEKDQTLLKTLKNQQLIHICTDAGYNNGYTPIFSA
jgi:hypothetical protein